MMMLMPNSVPTTHSAFNGQWAQIKMPRRIVTMASTRIQPHPADGRIWNVSTRRHDAVNDQETSNQQGECQQSSSGMHEEVNAGDDVDQPENAFQNGTPAGVGAKGVESIVLPH